MKDYNDYYKRNPSEMFYHSKFLDRLENDDYPDLIAGNSVSEMVLKGWLQVAIFNNRPIAAEKILDRLKLFTEAGLSLQERITLYTLGIE